MKSSELILLALTDVLLRERLLPEFDNLRTATTSLYAPLPIRKPSSTSTIINARYHE